MSFGSKTSKVASLQEIEHVNVAPSQGDGGEKLHENHVVLPRDYHSCRVS